MAQRLRAVLLQTILSGSLALTPAFAATELATRPLAGTEQPAPAPNPTPTQESSEPAAAPQSLETSAAPQLVAPMPDEEASAPPSHSVAIPENESSAAQTQVSEEQVVAKSSDKTLSLAAAPAQSDMAKPESFAYPPVPSESHNGSAPTGASEEFNAALVYAYQNQPQLKAEREALKITDEGVAQAVSGFRPTANANYTAGRGRNNDNDNTWFYSNSQQRGLTVNQPVFRGGSTVASYISAKDRVKAGRAQLEAIEQQVLLNAVIAYTDVVQKQSVLEVNQNNVDVLTRQLKATQARFDVGELTRTDIAQSQARLASAQAAERQALGDLAASQASFKRVIGYDAPSPILLPPVPNILPENIDQASLWAQQQNPTLEAARHLEKATASDVNVNTGAILPAVDVQGTMSRRDNATAGIFRAGNNDNDQLLLNVSIPLYQSGAEWSRARAAKNVAQQAKFNAIDTQQSVMENVNRAWQDYNTAKAVIASNEQAVKAAQIALDGVREEHLYGTRTILDVLDTEQSFFTARVNLVSATVAEKQQAYRLLAAVGRLTAKDLKLAVDLIDPKSHYDKVKYQLIGF